MKNRMMAFTAEVSIGPTAYGYIGAASDTSTGAAFTPHLVECCSSCSTTCTHDKCSVTCPTGYMAKCDCSGGFSYCRCIHAA